LIKISSKFRPVMHNPSLMIDEEEAEAQALNMGNSAFEL
jgi:hypothetical protein